jgi:xylulokinase
MGLLLGIDLGTSYFKVGLFDPDGTLRGLGRVAVAAESPAPGRVELPTALFWHRLRAGVRDALAQAQADPGEISGVSYSSQANTFVLLDGQGRELTPLVFWNDQRARPVEDELAGFGRSDEYAEATGLVGVVPERAAVKCRWFARHEAAIWAKAQRVLTISDYLTFCLTGEPVGDASTAALTGLYHLSGGTWWRPALATFGLVPHQLATPLAPGTSVGRTTGRAIELLGAPAGIPFAVGALDHHAAAIGSGLGQLADACLSTGTVLAALVLVDRVQPAPGVIHGRHLDGRFYRLSFDAAGAGQVEDYQRRAAPDLDVAELLRRAEQVTAHGAPRHGREVREILERIARTQADLLHRVAGNAEVQRVSATGGGARSAFWLQLTAEMTGREILAVDSPERACLGAAMFAAVAARIWPDADAAARSMVHPPRAYRPAPNRR